MDQEQANSGAQQGTDRIMVDALGSVAPSSLAVGSPPGSVQNQQGLNLQSTELLRCDKCHGIVAHVKRTTTFPYGVSARAVCLECAGGPKHCIACYGSLDQGLIAKPSPNCQCHYCGPCFNNFWRSKLADRNQYPPRCCFRGVNLNLDGLEGIMEPPILALYRQRHPEWTARFPVSCASCGLFLCDAYSRPTWTLPAKCFSCGVETCPMCHQLMNVHTGNGCPSDDDDDDFYDDTGGYPTFRCRTCRTHVTKLDDEGHTTCDHLICTGCNTDLCARCGMAIDECDSQDDSDAD